ncbi:hypothetical protein Moror_13621 [Moniliophthora roreri MCA 2997]|uniref:Uncharacterized protein n=2 Tax=Moniliophthora roreri TaxID=221103 RepID=V2X9M5_MONRO|nr:hypothetical protein Moror_13621 [Moniliophthora roreri MCA 2997]
MRLEEELPLEAICLRDDAKKSSGGLSVVSAKVIQIVLTDEDCWQYLSQVTKVVKPFVDAIGNCESRESTLADCMLQLLSCAHTLAAISCDDDEDEEFLAHAQRVLDRWFYKITTSAGFTLMDITNTTLSLTKKWNWSFEEATVLKKDIKLYYHCKEPFTGSTVLAIIIHSIVPHAAEIEQLFSHLNGVQTPKHNNLSTPTFKKLAKLRNHYDREIWEKNRAAGKSTHRKHAHMHAKDSPAITSTVTQELESCLTWEPPLDTDDSNLNSSQGEIEKDPVEDAFEQLEKEMMEEVTDEAGDSGPSLVQGEIFNFDEIKKALDGIVPTPYVETIEVVQEGGQTGTAPASFATYTNAKGFDEDPVGLWAHLMAIFGGLGVGVAVRMWREFLNVKYRGEEMTIVMEWTRSLANDLERIHNNQPSGTQIVAIMLNSIAEHPSFGDLITNLESLKDELEVDDVELRIVWKAKNLMDDGHPESGGVPTIAGHEAMVLVANVRMVQCKNPKCWHMGHTIEECFREGGKKEGQYLE